MVTNVIMPKLGATMSEGKIIKWYKDEGAKVEKGEVLFEIETEKFTFKVESVTSGILRKILVPVGTTVPVSQTVAIISSPGEELKEMEEGPPLVIAKPEKERIKVSPVAKRLAEEHGIDVTKIVGSGPGGRVVKEDVLSEIERLKTKTEALPAIKVAKTIPVTGMRRTIAERLSKSMRTTAHITEMIEIDVSQLVHLYKNVFPEIEKSQGIKPSYTDVIIMAVAKALKEHPYLNSMLDGEEIKLYEDINIGIAVALEEGLMVPVIRNADRKSLIEISLLTKDLVERARSGNLSMDETLNGTFTITNLGMYGVEFFTPIINPPETAILGVGAIKQKPVIENGEISFKEFMYLCLSFDHRVIDGAGAAKFLQTLKRLLENPYLLLFEPKR
ncbi:MAG: dihydrolipoamide acetyltransferase family protein [Candidatus Bathyarchaeia archaeon]